MSFLNISGYRFVTLENPHNLQQSLLSICSELAIKGTILLSHEGTNINLTGFEASIHEFKTRLQAMNELKGMRFHHTMSEFPIYKRLKVKIKKEIITFREKTVNPIKHTALYIKPTELKKWLDAKQDFILLDVRNDYEIALGSFTNARHLSLENFSELTSRTMDLSNSTPIVTFCTGGIRCEKAALFLMQLGHHKVFQLKGGIIGYFQEVGGAHFIGDCFVFDERIAIDSQLQAKSPI